MILLGASFSPLLSFLCVWKYFRFVELHNTKVRFDLQESKYSVIDWFYSHYSLVKSKILYSHYSLVTSEILLS